MRAKGLIDTIKNLTSGGVRKLLAYNSSFADVFNQLNPTIFRNIPKKITGHRTVVCVSHINSSRVGEK